MKKVSFGHNVNVPFQKCKRFSCWCFSSLRNMNLHEITRIKFLQHSSREDEIPHLFCEATGIWLFMSAAKVSTYRNDLGLRLVSSVLKKLVIQHKYVVVVKEM